jgi:ASC-1-like (ASCH) protein
MSITLNSPWFEYVRTGAKEYEGRCYRGKCLEFKPEDLLAISHHTNASLPPFNAKITDIKTINTFQKALENLPISKGLPKEFGEYTVEESVEIYKKYVKLSTQEEFGVCMIRLAVL